MERHYQGCKGSELQTSSACLSPAPKLWPFFFCPFPGNNNFQRFNSPPSPVRVQGRRTVLRSGGPHVAEHTALWWQLASKCGHQGTSQTLGGCSGSYLRDADTVGLIVEPRGVVVHISHLDVDRSLDHLPPWGQQEGAGVSFTRGFKT